MSPLRTFLMQNINILFFIHVCICETYFGYGRSSLNFLIIGGIFLKAKAYWFPRHSRGFIVITGSSRFSIGGSMSYLSIFLMQNINILVIIHVLHQ